MQQKKILSVLFVTLLLDMIGIGMLIPIIPSLFTDPSSHTFILRGYSVSAQYIVAGLMTALFGFMQFLMAPVLGEFSDIYGRKKLLTLGVGMLAIAQLLFATGVAFGSLIVLFVSRAIAGIAGSNFSIAQAAIADVTRPEERARNFGLIGAAFGLGFILGPLLGGILAGASGNPAVPFIFAGVLGVVNVLLVTFFFTETHHNRAPKGSITMLRAIHNIQMAYRDRDVRPLYFAGFFAMLGFGFFTAFISIYLAKRFGFSETHTGIYFGVVGVWIVFAQAVVVRLLSSRYSDQARLFYALPILAITIATQPFIPHEAILYAIMPLMTASFALVSTSIPALVSKGVSMERQGAALGINGSLQALSQAIAPLIAGVLSGVLGLTAAFIIGGICVFISFSIVYYNR